MTQAAIIDGKAFAEACKPVYDKFSAAYDPAIVNLFKTELERISKF